MLCNWLLSLATDNVVLAALIGSIISVLAEFWPGWDSLTFEMKRWVILGLCLGVPIAALLLGVYALACAGMVLTAATFAQAVAIGCAAFAASQVVHAKLRK
jgi:hypothetical protein